MPGGGELEFSTIGHILKPGLASSASKMKEAAPLMVAARTNAQIVAFLLQSKADHRIRGFMGTTALHSAAIKHQRDSILVLVKAGAEVNAQDDGGYTPALYVACKFGPQRKQALSALVANRANPSIPDKGGNSVFTCARRDAELAAILRELGVKF